MYPYVKLQKTTSGALPLDVTGDVDFVVITDICFCGPSCDACKHISLKKNIGDYYSGSYSCCCYLVLIRTTDPSITESKKEKKICNRPNNKCLTLEVGRNIA